MTSVQNSSLANSAISKAGWRIIPLLSIGYLTAYIDRVNVSFASTQMNVDLGFSATVYGLGAGLFYLSYSLVEIPSNMLLMRFGARAWLARIMIMWGVIAAAMMFVQTPNHFYALRFLLGLAEAGFFPGVLYYLSHWFPTRQRGRAVAMFYLANPLAVSVMGLISGPLLALDGTGGLRGWQWLYLLQGLPAVLIGVLVFAFLPNTPDDARWLSPEERTALQTELDKHPVADEDHSGGGVLAVLSDRRVQLLAAIYVVTLSCATAFLLSGPAILMEMTGWNLPEVSNIIFYGGLLGAATMLITGWVTDWMGQRYTALIIALTVDMFAYALIVLGGTPTLIMAGFVLAQMGRGIQATAQAALWTDVLRQRRLAIGVAAISSVANMGTFLLPFAFGWSRDATGGYITALYFWPPLHLLAVGLGLVLYLDWKRRGSVKAG